jgi:glycosyltransferase involved in cell wall biosynthesis
MRESIDPSRPKSGLIGTFGALVSVIFVLSMRLLSPFLKPKVAERLKGHQPTVFIYLKLNREFSGQSGVDRLSRSVARELVALRTTLGKRTRVITATPISFGFRELLSFECSPIIGGQATFRKGDSILFLSLDHIMYSSYKTIIQSMKSSGIGIFFVLYDLLPIKFPSFFPNGPLLKNLHKDLLSLMARSTGVFCISKSVRNEYLAYLSQIDPHVKVGAEVKVIPMGVSMGDYSSRPLELESSKTVGEKWVLMVGTLEPRKGHLDAFEAMDRVWAKTPQVTLIVLGARGWHAASILNAITKSQLSGQRIKWLSKASDRELRFLYQNSDLLLMTSHGEGFGLPIIEAGEFGLPQLARDIPVFREIGSDITFFFEESSPAALADRITLVLTAGKSGVKHMAPRWADTARVIDEFIERGGL